MPAVREPRSNQGTSQDKLLDGSARYPGDTQCWSDQTSLMHSRHALQRNLFDRTYVVSHACHRRRSSVRVFAELCLWVSWLVACFRDCSLYWAASCCCDCFTACQMGFPAAFGSCPAGTQRRSWDRHPIERLSSMTTQQIWDRKSHMATLRWTPTVPSSWYLPRSG